MIPLTCPAGGKKTDVILYAIVSRHSDTTDETVLSCAFVRFIFFLTDWLVSLKVLLCNLIINMITLILNVIHYLFTLKSLPTLLLPPTSSIHFFRLHFFLLLSLTTNQHPSHSHSPRPLPPPPPSQLPTLTVPPYNSAAGDQSDKELWLKGEH